MFADLVYLELFPFLSGNLGGKGTCKGGEGWLVLIFSYVKMKIIPFVKFYIFLFLYYCPQDLTTKIGLCYSFTWNSHGHDNKGIVMQIEKAQINDRIRVSKIS